MRQAVDLYDKGRCGCKSQSSGEDCRSNEKKDPIIKQQWGHEIFELNTAIDSERIRKVYDCPLFFPWCLLIATVRDRLLGQTDHQSAPMQPVLKWERISTAWAAWMHQHAGQPALPWGSSPPPLMGRSRSAGREQEENGSVWLEQLSDVPH